MAGRIAAVSISVQADVGRTSKVPGADRLSPVILTMLYGKAAYRLKWKYSSCHAHVLVQFMASG